MDFCDLDRATLSAADTVTERRASVRHRVGTRVQITDKITASVLGYAHDISASGIRIELVSPVAIGLRYALAVEFRIHGQQRLPVEAVARCVWRRADPELKCNMAGFEFVSMSDEARLRLDAVIDELQVSA